MVLSIEHIALSLVIGLGTGFVLQKGRICSNTAFRNLLMIRNAELALILVITVAVELVGYLLLQSVIPNFGLTSSPIPFSLIILPIGAFIFGLGTVFAGGCAGGTCYRIGEGSLKSLLAFFGFFVGIVILSVGPIASEINIIRTATDWQLQGQVPSLELFLPRWIWTGVAVIITSLAIYWYYNNRKNKNLKLTHLLPRWTPILSGLLLGSFGVIARYSSTMSGRPFGLSTVDGIFNLYEIIFVDLQLLSWIGLFIIGLLFGSFFSALIGNEFKINVPNRSEIFRYFGGGLVMGIGAVMAIGCNFGHIFGGLPELGISSIVATALMLLGNWAGSYLFYTQLNNKLPNSTPVAL